MLPRLKNDHKHIAILLKILKNKYKRLADGEYISFSLIRDIVEYMQGYAEHSHHPLEDIVYEYCLTKVSAEDKSKRLFAEHDRLIEASASLMSTLSLILNDVVVAREQVVQDLQDYVVLQEAHMLFEEAEIFPLLASTMDEEDWQKIATICEEKLVEDPLFSNDDNQLFEELKQHIAKDEER